MKEACPLPVGASSDCAAYLQQRRNLLDARLRTVADKAGRGKLEDVRVSSSSLKITPLKAVTPRAAEDLANRLYALLPKVRITDLLGDIAKWMGSAPTSPICDRGCPSKTTT